MPIDTQVIEIMRKLSDRASAWMNDEEADEEDARRIVAAAQAQLLAVTPQIAACTTCNYVYTPPQGMGIHRPPHTCPHCGAKVLIGTSEALAKRRTQLLGGDE